MVDVREMGRTALPQTIQRYEWLIGRCVCVCLMLSNRMDSICGRANGQVMEYRIMAPIWYRFFVPKSTIWRAIFFVAK